MKLKISIDFEKNKYAIIALYLNITLVTRFVSSAFSIITRRTFGYVGILQWGLLILPLIYFFLNIFRHGVKRKQIYIFMIWSVLMLYTFFVTKPKSYLMNQAFVEGFSHIVIPAIMIQEVSDVDKMLDALEKYVGICTITCLLQFLSPVLTKNAYYSFSYITFFPAAICLANILKGNYKKNLLPFIIITASNLIFGGRGFFLCVAVFIVLYSLMYYRTNKNVLILAMIFMIATLVFSLFGDMLISAIAELGVSSRVLSFVTGELSDNSRLSIWTSLLSEFAREPFKIRGLLSDREYLAVVFHRYSEQAIASWYSHNFIVEIIFEFGTIGILILLLLFRNYFKISKSLRKKDDEKEILLFFMISSLFLAKMSISSSYLIDLSTGIFIGFMLVYKDIVHMRINENYFIQKEISNI